MTDEIKNQILTECLAEIAGSAGGSGARRGAKWSARRIKIYDHTGSAQCKLPLTVAINCCIEIIAGLPNFITFIDEDSNIPCLWAVVGSGALSLNPTIICLEFTSATEDITAIQITASAKEGLIKQKSAEKAVQQLKQLLI